MLGASMPQPSHSKREHLRSLVAAKQQANEPLSEGDALKGFRGWHERGYLPHCDKPGLIQFITFRVWDSMPAAKRGEWEHLLAISPRSDPPNSKAGKQRVRKLEDYLDRGLGECSLCVANIAALVEKALLHHHERRFRLLAWVVMPNHVHALIEVGETPLTKIIQNWKSIVAVEANKMLVRRGPFWQPDYWDHYMRDVEQTRKTVRYIENNPVKAKLCRAAEDWPFSSVRFRNPQTGELKLPSQ
jgi:REP element-mobilizing transposase RayT